jgi:hypothetical protein
MKGRKGRKDKPEKSAEAGGESRRQNALPVDSARRTPAHGEVLTAAKKDGTPKDSGPEVWADPPDRVGPPEPPVRLPALQHISVSRSSGFVVKPDRDPDSKDALDQNQSTEDPIWEEYLDMDTSSFNLLSGYSAEEEVEAAMLEADLAMQADESALMVEEGMEVFEMAPDDVSLVWAEEDADFTAVE